MITSNTIALTKNGGLDLTAFETTWEHQGYGEAGAGVVTSVVGKPGVSKGGGGGRLSSFLHRTVFACISTNTVTTLHQNRKMRDLAHKDRARSIALSTL